MLFTLSINRKLNIKSLKTLDFNYNYTYKVIHMSDYNYLLVTRQN